MFKPWRPHPCRDTRFQLIDEHGAGVPYAGLAYELVDRHGQVHHGYLDASGAGKAGKQIAGPVAIRFTQAHDRSRAVYSRLMDRPHYPLYITELQVRAEQTRWLNTAGERSQTRPAPVDTDADYFQVEVRHLVEHVSHLPPWSIAHTRRAAGRRASPWPVAVLPCWRFALCEPCARCCQPTRSSVRLTSTNWR